MIAFLDIEASGLGEGSYPIEIGWAFPFASSKNGSFLVKPEPHWTHWSMASQDVHGIRREVLDVRGIPVEEGRAIVDRLLSKAEIYVDNPPSDRAWFAGLYEGLSWRRPELHDARGLFEAEALKRRKNLSMVAEQVSRRWRHEHRALPDARRLAEIWRALTRF